MVSSFFVEIFGTPLSSYNRYQFQVQKFSRKIFQKFSKKFTGNFPEIFQLLNCSPINFLEILQKLFEPPPCIFSRKISEIV